MTRNVAVAVALLGLPLLYVYTTNMAAFLKAAAYRGTVYRKQFPTGTWLEVKGLALPEFMIEIELEAHKPRDAGR